MKKILYCFILTLTFVWGCSSGNQKNESDIFDSIANSSKSSNVTKEDVEKILKSFPSPLEINSLIKESGSQYNDEMLNKVENVSNYNRSFNKALNLGIYVTDMGYINIYEKTYTSLKYLDAVKILSNDLKVGQFFDFNSIKRLASNRKNADSILYISTRGFEKMNSYLSDKNRSNVSSLILVGGWIEGLYISTQIVKSKYKKELVDKIGEQKIPLENIYKLLSAYNNEPNFKELVKDFSDLKSLYDGVTISYSQSKEPQMKEVDGRPVFVDNTKSTINISNDLLNKIIEKTSNIRNKIIK
ncbi:MAG: hypothetical protein Q8880_03780 [Bacteroidota bacterium]|nr:hypothetical protein [Bacteroidota bacterium]